MKKVILASMMVGALVLTGCASVQQNQQPQPQVQAVQKAYDGPIQEKKTDYAIYGIHRGEKPLVVFQGIVMNVQPYSESKSETLKSVNGFLTKLNPSLALKDPNAVQMMDITIGTANKQQFHYKQEMNPGFQPGKIILVVQFNNGDTILDPDLSKTTGSNLK